MASILDDVLAATPVAYPVILGEQHDTGAISWVGGVTDPGEMIGCGRYQELRRLAGEGDEAYQERLTRLLPTLPAEHRHKIETAMKAAAVRRASLDTSTGKVAVMVAGKAPWHGLGVNVADAVSSADAIRLAALNWRVEKTPLQYVQPLTNALCEAPGLYGLVRQDTGAMLGSCGKVYSPIQNAEGFEFLDGVLGQFGARYESAGAIYGGKQVWMLVRLPKQAFAVNGKDRVEPYAIFTNSHEPGRAAKCYPTSERVVCANTFRIAEQGRGGAGITVHHIGNHKERMKDAQRALGLAVEGIAEFAANAQVLARTPTPDIRHYCNDVLDAVLEVTAADALKGADLLAAALKATEAEQELARKSFDRKIERRGEILEEMLARYESDRCGVNGMRGTAWAAFNAVTETADHGSMFRYTGADDTTKASRRFESVVAGQADELKQVGYQTALALAT